ncbi:helix-turn-helix domain-containing protein [Streptomyces sp. NPDC087440]|uniref:helix-turn-helix domain-containing protein n=1 Tax=Streptomyces sp. NPDC087440 TaxID=3365790 RepID=UPI00382CF71F
MPRWKALPEGLDPQVREFANQLRRLVDRSGLSVAAVADRTGYSKTSWERYLNGRLLAPKGAVVALSEVTGTNPVHLTTMWELAERAWSRSEMRHDMTMEAIRISQARAALGEFGAPVAQNAKSRKAGTTSLPPGQPAPRRLPDPSLTDTGQQRRAARPNTDAFDMTTNLKIPSELKARTGAVPSARPGQGPSASARTAPSRPAPGRPESERGYASDFERGFSQGQSYNSPSASSSSSSSSASSASGGYDRPAGPPGSARPGPPPPNSAPDRQRQRRKLTMFLAGVVGALLVIVAAVLLTGGDDEKDKKPTAGNPPATSESKSKAPKLPAGVKCNGKACDGKDPEQMGCGGEYAVTSARGTVGAARIEVRYSKTCGAAWARITGAGGGDKVTVSSDTSAAGRNGLVGATATDAYTAMVEAATADEARACATLKSGKKGCTTAG